ncbi:hypothetical protein HPB49_026647 [Dermacentor silvarum]|nr:hypothetical protein HPB49_026647 [Dermacentor silvarum]
MLAPDAVPTILPNLPAYLTLKTPAPRTQTKRRHQGVPAENDNRKRRRISTPAQVLVDTNCATSAGSDEADKASSSPSSEAVVTLDDLRGLDLPSKSWALHEFPGFDGVSYVACSLNSSTRELSIERAVFFSSANNGSVECEAFVQDKLISKSSLVMVQEASDALQLVASVPLCCGAAETSVLPPSDLTHGLHAQMKLRGEIFYSVKCMGKSGKEAGRVSGFVDLGAYTPKEEKQLPCDHGLVVMFVPLTGSWSQILGTFATRTNIKGELLAKIVLEATILAEKAGLFVNYVTCDAATWNRKMWRIMGVKANSKEVIAKRVHTSDDKRSLYFLSDFPHLVKNIRNRLLQTSFHTPDGKVSMGPLREALKIDENNLTLKAMPRLTKTHIEPNNFEKMRVSLAFQIFGSDSLRGLQLYKSQLEKCCGNIEPTQKFFRMADDERLPGNSQTTAAQVEFAVAQS